MLPAVARLIEDLTGSEGPLGPASSTNDGGGLLLALRVALLGVVFASALSTGDPRGRRAIALTGAVAVASLVARALLLPYVAVALVVARRSPRALAAGLGLVGLTMVAIPVSPTHALGPDPLDPSGDPAAETLAWARRDNAFLARAWAARWASTEPSPGIAHLALARGEWALGHEARARTLVLQVARAAPDGALRDEATHQSRAWETAR